MPELPEVETVCRGLRPPLLGRVLTSVAARRPDLRKPLPPDLATQLTGRRVRAIDRRAKYILLRTEDATSGAEGPVMIAHLGMSGRMTISPAIPNEYDKHDHVIFITDQGVVVRFNDPRRFGLIDLAAPAALDGHPLLAGIGPEPLSDAFTAAGLHTALAGRRSPIKSVLLDQGVVAGIGNIYASEALFTAGIHPERLAHAVTAAECAALVAAIQAVLARAIAAGGSSLRDHVQPSGELGYFQHQWAVYGRAGERCPGCTCGNGDIQRLVQANRSSFYCPHRQH